MEVDRITIRPYQRKPGDRERYCWNVHASVNGELRWENGLTFDKALATCALLLSQRGTPPIYLHTTEQHALRERMHEEAIANIADRIDSAPEDQRREPVLVGAVQCLAERLALQGDAAFAYKVCEEAGVEPPANVKREIEGDAA